MPFTLAHAAAALPLRRTRLVFSAVVMGTFAPDFEYFLYMLPHGAFGHTPLGMFVFSLPAALVALWMYHRWIKPVLILMMPLPLRERLAPYLSPFEFGPRRRFGWLAVSAFVGVALHVGWDSFTHPASPIVRHVAALRDLHTVPGLGAHQLCRILQQASTLGGLAVLLVWSALWYARAERTRLAEPHQARYWRLGLWILLPLGAVAGGLVRIVLGSRGSPLRGGYAVVSFAIAWMAMLWWLLALAGYFADSSGELKRHLRTVNTALTPAPDTDE